MAVGGQWNWPEWVGPEGALGGEARLFVGKRGLGLVPLEGFEPPTPSLRMLYFIKFYGRKSA